mmetsp:Transcript_43388/g.97661  ORF Transcript_43388/g.97661 Transcript_43388/m.97661 type:complete len:322 (-) Transcript_43388:412-1377(-)
MTPEIRLQIVVEQIKVVCRRQGVCKRDYMNAVKLVRIVKIGVHLGLFIDHPWTFGVHGGDVEKHIVDAGRVTNIQDGATLRICLDGLEMWGNILLKQGGVRLSTLLALQSGELHRLQSRQRRSVSENLCSTGDHSSLGNALRYCEPPALCFEHHAHLQNKALLSCASQLRLERFERVRRLAGTRSSNGQDLKSDQCILRRARSFAGAANHRPAGGRRRTSGCAGRNCCRSATGRRGCLLPPIAGALTPGSSSPRFLLLLLRLQPTLAAHLPDIIQRSPSRAVGPRPTRLRRWCRLRWLRKPLRVSGHTLPCFAVFDTISLV